MKSAYLICSLTLLSTFQLAIYLLLTLGQNHQHTVTANSAPGRWKWKNTQKSRKKGGKKSWFRGVLLTIPFRAREYHRHWKFIYFIFFLIISRMLGNLEGKWNIQNPKWRIITFFCLTLKYNPISSSVKPIPIFSKPHPPPLPPKKSPNVEWKRKVGNLCVPYQEKRRARESFFLLSDEKKKPKT